MDHQDVRRSMREWDRNAALREKERGERAVSREALLDAMYPERLEAREAERAEKAARIEQKLEQEYPELPCDGPNERKHRDDYRAWLVSVEIDNGISSSLEKFRSDREDIFASIPALLISLVITPITMIYTVLTSESGPILGVVQAAFGSIITLAFSFWVLEKVMRFTVIPTMRWRWLTSDEHRDRYLRYLEERQKGISETDADLRLTGSDLDPIDGGEHK